MKTKNYIITGLCVALVACIVIIANIWNSLELAQNKLEFYKTECQEMHESIKTSQFGQLVRFGEFCGLTVKSIHTSYNFGGEDKSKSENIHTANVCYMDRAGHLYFHDNKRCDKCNPDINKAEVEKLSQMYNAAKEAELINEVKALRGEIRIKHEDATKTLPFLRLTCIILLLKRLLLLKG